MRKLYHLLDNNVSWNYVKDSITPYIGENIFEFDDIPEELSLPEKERKNIAVLDSFK